MPLQKRINILRKAKSDCKHMIKHFKNDCDRLFVIFSGTRYKNNKVFPIERVKRLKREDYWVKRLRTIYPCGLNERARKHNSEVPVGKLFFFIPRTKQRSARFGNNNDYLKNDTITNFFTNSHNIWLYVIIMSRTRFRVNLHLGQFG